MTGLTLRAITDSTGRSRRELRIVLHAEVECGRVARQSDGRYALIPHAFAPAVLRALQMIDHDTGRAPEGGERWASST